MNFSHFYQVNLENKVLLPLSLPFASFKKKKKQGGKEIERDDRSSQFTYTDTKILFMLRGSVYVFHGFI